MVIATPRRLYADIYDANLNATGKITPKSDVSSMSFTQQWLGVGTGNITIPVGHRLAGALAAPGARVKFRYESDTAVRLAELAGNVDATATQLNNRDSTITFTIVSDDALLGNLAWPVPTAALNAQTNEYYTATGAVEQVIPELLRVNLVERLGIPVTIVPMFPEGPTVTVKARFQTLWEVVRPILEATNRGLRIRQWMPNSGDIGHIFLPDLSEPTILVEVVRQAEKPWMVWGPDKGISSGVATGTAPGTTRVVVGGQGEGTARTLIGLTDAARESEWGPYAVRETFVDARDTGDATTIEQRAAEALSEGAPKAAISGEAVEGDPWTVGIHYSIGDRVPIAPAGEITAYSVIRSITFAVSANDGVTVVPKIGELSATAEPDEALARAVSKIAARTRTLETRR